MMHTPFRRVTLLTVAGLILLACSQPQAPVYVGHWASWSDDGGHRKGPARFALEYSADSLTATMNILDSVGRPDPVSIRWKQKDQWELIEWKSRQLHDPFDVNIRRSNDSLTVSFGFGFSGVGYFGKRQ